MAKAKTTIKKITQNAWECTKIFKTGEIEKRIVKDPIDIWSIGNTGVRNPWRIPGGYKVYVCLLYTSPSPRDISGSRMPSSA